MSVIEFFLSGVCHQLPEHSLHIGGRPLPLCARCTGTHVGVVIALIVLWASGQGRRSGLPPHRATAFLAVLVGAWLVDGVNSLAQWVTGTGWLYEPSNGLRLATGLGVGLAVGVILYPIFHFAMWRRSEDRRVLERATALVPVLAAGAVAFVTTLIADGAPRLVWVFACVAPVAVTLTLANALLIVLAIQREGRANGWLDVVPYLGVGLVASLAETGALGLVKRLIGS